MYFKSNLLNMGKNTKILESEGKLASLALHALKVFYFKNVIIKAVKRKLRISVLLCKFICFHD